MLREEVIIKVNNILNLLEKHRFNYPNHDESCLFLSEKYRKINEAIKTESKTLPNLIEWNKWFAPRIIFDGINNKEILYAVEELNNLLEN